MWSVAFCNSAYRLCIDRISVLRSFHNSEHSIFHDGLNKTNISHLAIVSSFSMHTEVLAMLNDI